MRESISRAMRQHGVVRYDRGMMNSHFLQKLKNGVICGIAGPVLFTWLWRSQDSCSPGYNHVPQLMRRNLERLANLMPFSGPASSRVIPHRSMLSLYQIFSTRRA